MKTFKNMVATAFASYALVYLPWFSFLKVRLPWIILIHIINGPLDDMIPFCEVFIIPYFYGLLT